MDKVKELEKFMEALKKAFPEASSKTTKTIIERGFEEKDKVHYIWLEIFADATNELMKKRYEEESKSHLLFMSNELAKNNQAIVDAIDVGYVENLMFKFSGAEKKWAWRLFPENLKVLYEEIWGKPSF